jgi:hypothetical protein
MNGPALNGRMPHVEGAPGHAQADPNILLQDREDLVFLRGDGDASLAMRPLGSICSYTLLANFHRIALGYLDALRSHEMLDVAGVRHVD